MENLECKMQNGASPQGLNAKCANSAFIILRFFIRTAPVARIDQASAF